MLLWKSLYRCCVDICFLLLGRKPGVELLGYMIIFMISILRNWQTLFQSVYTNLHFYQQYSSVQIFPILTINCYFMSFDYILVNVKLYIIVVFIFICLRTNTLHVISGHFNIFFGKIFIQLLCPFCVIYSFIMSCKSSLYILDANPSSDIWLENTFPLCDFFWNT